MDKKHADSRATQLSLLYGCLFKKRSQKCSAGKSYARVFTASSLPLPKLKPRVPSGIRGPGGGLPRFSDVNEKLD
jgi:hypothetical protein